MRDEKKDLIFSTRGNWHRKLFFAFIFLFLNSTVSCFSSENTPWDKTVHLQNILAAHYTPTLWNPAHFALLNKNLIIPLAGSSGLSIDTYKTLQVKLRETSVGINRTEWSPYGYSSPQSSVLIGHKILKTLAAGVSVKGRSGSPQYGYVQPGSDWDAGISWKPHSRWFIETLFMDLKNSETLNFHVSGRYTLNHADVKSSVLYTFPFKKASFYGTIDRYEGKEFSGKSFTAHAFGVEAWWKNKVSVRFTRSENYDVKGITLGFGSFHLASDFYKKKYGSRKFSFWGLAFILIFGGN